jgi:hypothetical protein
MPTPSYLPVSFDTSALVPQQRPNEPVKGPCPALLSAAVLPGKPWEASGCRCVQAECRPALQLLREEGKP